MNDRRDLRLIPLPAGGFTAAPAALVALAAAVAAIALVAPVLRSKGEVTRATRGRLAPVRSAWLARPESVIVRDGPAGLPSSVGAVARDGARVLWTDPVGGTLFQAMWADSGLIDVRAVREHEPGVRLRRPEGLAVSPERTWVLDVASGELLAWTRGLRAAERIRLGSRPGVWTTPMALAADARGRPLVLSREIDLATGRARWAIDRRDSGTALVRVWTAAAPSLRGGLDDFFDRPVLASRPEGGFLVAHSESYRVLALGEGGDTLWVARRRDRPRFALTSEERKSYRRTLERLPASLRRRLPAPKYWPPVAWVHGLPGDRWIAAIRADDEAWHVEVARRDGKALGRVTPDAMTPPPLYAGGFLVQAVVRERDVVLRWHRLRLDP